MHDALKVVFETGRSGGGHDFVGSTNGLNPPSPRTGRSGRTTMSPGKYQ